MRVLAAGSDICSALGASGEAVFLGDANEQPEVREIEMRKHAAPPSTRSRPL